MATSSLYGVRSALRRATPTARCVPQAEASSSLTGRTSHAVIQPLGTMSCVTGTSTVISGASTLRTWREIGRAPSTLNSKRPSKGVVSVTFAVSPTL